ncbi:MAG TPA: class I SAM-dependent methyltransferase [Acetobacteraceae bacterium]
MVLLPSHFFPPHNRNRMAREGDVLRARGEFIAGGSRNLRALLRQRYEWMNEFIDAQDIVVELGCGAGLTPFFVRNGTLFVTDVHSYPWAAATVNALCLPFRPASVDAFICVNVIHHLAAPVSFLDSVRFCLKPGGYILVHEPNPSVLMLAALRLMNHEGWSLDVDIFDPESIANDPSDPWSGNNAISRLLFSDPRFASRFPDLRIVRDRFTECLMFPLSGGVTAKTWSLELPDSVLKVIARIDNVLCSIAPSALAMGRSMALQKELQS